MVDSCDHWEFDATEWPLQDQEVEEDYFESAGAAVRVCNCSTPLVDFSQG